MFSWKLQKEFLLYAAADQISSTVFVINKQKGIILYLQAINEVFVITSDEWIILYLQAMNKVFVINKHKGIICTYKPWMKYL